MNAKLYVGNDNLVTVTGLFDRVLGQYVNAASVTATVLDQNGATVSGITLPISLAYLSGSNGDYYGTLGQALNIIDGASYKAVITASSLAGEALWTIPVQAINRISS